MKANAWRTGFVTASHVAVALIVTLIVACTSPDPDRPRERGVAWVGAIETEGDVTVVRNQSGSVWGADAELVEEASIGVESGGDEYMLGRVTAVWATDDWILVADHQVPAVRAYDLDGNYLYDIGRPGQGPGEYEGPSGVGVTPDGTILVLEESMRVNVFAPDRSPSAIWNTGSGVGAFGPGTVMVGHDGTPWVLTMQRPASDPGGAFRRGMQRIGPDGPFGEPVLYPEADFARPCLEYPRGGRTSRYCSIPFMPSSVAILTPAGAVVSGISDSYRFEIAHPDGRVTRIERYWDPVPVSREEAEWHKRRVTRTLRQRSDDPAWSWNGPEIPESKPAYRYFWPDRSDRVWVVREGASVKQPGCDEEADNTEPASSTPCWSAPEIWDAFDSDGRYLGALRPPDGVSPLVMPFIRGDTFVLAVEDHLGTPMVKRYRLKTPEAP